MMERMRLLFSLISSAYIAAIFLLSGSRAVTYFAPFNPFSLLHIPLYGILTVLIIFSLFPFDLKANVPNVLNDPNHPNVTNEHNVINERNASTHLRINTYTRVRFLISGIIALVVAIADEIYQSFIPTRDASILDVFLDFVGIVLVLFLVYRLAKGKYLFGFKLITDSMTQ